MAREHRRRQARRVGPAVVVAVVKVAAVAAVCWLVRQKIPHLRHHRLNKQCRRQVAAAELSPLVASDVRYSFDNDKN